MVMDDAGRFHIFSRYTLAELVLDPASGSLAVDARTTDGVTTRFVVDGKADDRTKLLRFLDRIDEAIEGGAK